MLDLKYLRDAVAAAKERLARKGVEAARLDAILDLDERRRSAETSLSEMQAERNTMSKSIGQIIKEGGDAEAAKAEVRELGDRIKEAEVGKRGIDEEQQMLLAALPNYPHEASPVGGEAENKVLKEWGKKPEFGFEPKDHKTLGEGLGIMDFERAARMSGAGFSLLKGRGAALERGLIRWMIDLHVREHGYTEIAPPYLVAGRSLYGTGQFPKLRDDMYHAIGGGVTDPAHESDEELDDLWLIPTAEVPVTNIHADEILEVGEVPLKYVAASPCFRREAGSYGKDTSGLHRMHQFMKVEMVRYALPEEGEQEHEELLANAEAVLQAFGLHYRVLDLATGDMSFAAHRCYDIEVWAPGAGRYLEVSSCSNFIDFQARRAKIRFRREAGAKPEFVHTLNASGVALPRLMIALMENYQTEDGDVLLPGPVAEACGFETLR